MEKPYVVDCIITVITAADIINRDIKVKENTSLFKECGLNSVDIIDIIVRIEDKFNFEFDNSQLMLGDFETASSIADAVLRQLGDCERV